MDHDQYTPKSVHVSDKYLKESIVHILHGTSGGGKVHFEQSTLLFWPRRSRCNWLYIVSFIVVQFIISQFESLEITQHTSFTECRIFVIPLFKTYYKVSMIVQISLAFLVLYETSIFVTILTNVVKHLFLVGKTQVVQYKQLVSILQDLSRVRVHQNMVAMEF